MKKYANFDERVPQRRDALQQKYDELQLFQYLLRNSEPMNKIYHGKARAIANGLQPWIDALERSLSK